MRGRETARVTALSSPLQLYSLAVSMNLRQNVESVDRLTEAYFSVIVNCVSCSKTLQSSLSRGCRAGLVFTYHPCVCPSCADDTAAKAKNPIMLRGRNRPFPCYLVPLFENESACKTSFTKWLWFAWKWTLKWNLFSYEWFRTRLVLTQWQKATQK